MYKILYFQTNHACTPLLKQDKIKRQNYNTLMTLTPSNFAETLKKILQM